MTDDPSRPDAPDATPPGGIDVETLRARDFWAGLALAAASVFFLWRTTRIPFWEPTGGGVTGAGPWASAGLVPFGIFGALLILSLILIGISIRTGGAARALSAAGIGLDGAEVWRLLMLAVILTGYIAGLVPRVDFAIASALLIQALVAGFHRGDATRMGICAAAVAVPSIYALVVHFPQAEWNSFHDDDWIALAAFVLLALWSLRRGTPRAEKVGIVVAVLAPVLLVSAMAFGFRQNVPNRGGLIFEQLQYHWYVTLKPLRGA